MHTKERLIFVSHSSVDTWVARQIAREIEVRGGKTFLDEAQIEAGADFEEDILKFLEKAHELVVLLTPWALERDYVVAEIGAAWVRRIPIVALLLGITAAELQARPGALIVLKKRNLLQLNKIDIYLDQLAARIREHKNKGHGRAKGFYLTFRERRRLGAILRSRVEGTRRVGTVR